MGYCCAGAMELGSPKMVAPGAGGSFTVSVKRSETLVSALSESDVDAGRGVVGDVEEPSALVEGDIGDRASDRDYAAECGSRRHRNGKHHPAGDRKEFITHNVGPFIVWLGP